MLKSLLRLVNIKVILGGVVLAVCVFAVLVWVLWSARARDLNPVPVTAILNIVDAPTSTPIAPMATLTPTPQATRSADVPLPGVEISIGEYVQVKGTGGSGLRLHASPGVASDVRYVAIDAEVFVVKDGPVDADGYKWWQLQDPYTASVGGWGVADYLAVVKSP